MLQLLYKILAIVIIAYFIAIAYNVNKKVSYVLIGLDKIAKQLEIDLAD